MFPPMPAGRGLLIWSFQKQTEPGQPRALAVNNPGDRADRVKAGRRHASGLMDLRPVVKVAVSESDRCGLTGLAAPFVGRRPTPIITRLHFIQSAHRGGASVPQGMMGTVEVEFFGLPSISLSE